MQVLSVGPVRTGSCTFQQRGTFVLTVVCKTTFWLRPGEAVVAPEQEAINEADDHWDDDPNRSVRASSDLMPMKMRPEVTLVGYAYAPNKQVVRSLVARLVVGDVDKSIEVFCDRTFLPDGSLQEGQRFSRMRLTWERAGGGPQTNNPVGVRHDARDSYGRRTVPNLQPVGMHVSNVDEFIPPTGFGPIAATWPSRADLIARAPQAVAEGLDGPSAAYYNAAPSDQLLSVLRENERIVLENLHPEHARLVTSLPGFRPAIFVDRGRGPAQRVTPRADSLWIDTDRGIATLTWRAHVPLAHRDEPGQVVVGMEAPGLEMTWGALSKALNLNAADNIDDDDDHIMETITTTGSLLPVSAALPFAAKHDPEPPPPPREPMRSSHDLPFYAPNAAAPPQAPAAPPPRPTWSPTTTQAAPRVPNIKPPAIPPPSASSSGVSSSPRPVLPGTPVAPAPGAPPVSLATPPFVPSAPPIPPAPTPSAPPPPMVAPPAHIMAPPMALSGPHIESGGSAGSPWAGSGSSGPAQRETLGTQAAAAAAAALNMPKEPPSDGGALAASNEAAGVRPWSAPRRELRTIIAADEPGQDKPSVSRELLHLVWFDPSFVPRIRRVEAWKQILEDLAERGPDKGIDDVLAGKEAWEIEDRREIFEIVAKGDRADEPRIAELMDEAILEDGKFATPIILVGCEVEMPFDELEVLRALSTAAAPLVGPTDELLKNAVEAAEKFLARGNTSYAPVVPEGLSNRIRESFARDKKSLPADALDVQAERALLGGRHYQKREVLGGTYLRMLLRMSQDSQPFVGYAPQDIAKKLPMFRKFRARIIAELHPWQDQYETRRESLRALAIGTVTYVDRTGAAGNAAKN